MEVTESKHTIKLITVVILSYRTKLLRLSLSATYTIVQYMWARLRSLPVVESRVKDSNRVGSSLAHQARVKETNRNT